MKEFSASQIEAVAKAGRVIRDIRRQVLVSVKGGFRAVYQILDLPGPHPLKDAHLELDEAVLKTYGFSSEENLLERLLQLNQEVAKRIERGEAVTRPGVPGSCHSLDLISSDCIIA